MPGQRQHCVVKLMLRPFGVDPDEKRTLVWRLDKNCRDTAAMTGVAQPGGIALGPTATGKHYLSLFAHRGANPRKSVWAISVADEFEVFSRCDGEDWFDNDGHLWGAVDSGGSKLGTRGERLAKFPSTAPANPWHGYPVSPASGRDSEIPPDALIERLRHDGRLTRTFARKLQTRRA